MKRALLLLLLLAPAFLRIYAQDDLMKMLDEGSAQRTDYTTATFKTTKVVIGPSPENPAKGDLLFLVTHHFGALNTGYENLYGLKQATIRLGLECGFTGWFAGGFGLNTLDNTWDGFLKAKVLRQSTGGRKMPVTLVVIAGMSAYTTKRKEPDRDNLFSSRFSYNFQAIAARKFGERFSLQIVPGMVHMNLVPTRDDHNNVFSLGAGGRLKLSNRVSVNAEYHYLFPGQVVSTPAYSSLSMGIDIETGGHVFQIFMTNSMGEIMEYIIPKTTGTWANGNIFLGFNISRVFTIF